MFKTIRDFAQQLMTIMLFINLAAFFTFFAKGLDPAHEQQRGPQRDVKE